MTNTLYFGDNLPILRSMPANSVDLIYLDPPFNSSRSYNVLFKNESGVSSDAQITAFDDTWHWGPSAEEAYLDILQANPGTIDDLLAALRTIIGENQMLAYLVMMAARLVELHRVLKPTGSLYLHCDPTASHYLKIVLDTIFGIDNFKNEIIWHYSGWNAKLNDSFNSRHDVILFYGKSNKQIFNSYSIPWKSEDEYIKIRKQKVLSDEEGNKYVLSDGGGGNRVRRYLGEAMAYGKPIDDVWSIDKINNSSKEALGYPTQKPIILLDRIIQASSNPGDIVMDPFCGCGTAIAAAEKLGRQWIGIDITYLSINLIENRMKAMFPGIQFEVVGKPKDLASARDLAQRDRYQFQWWALSLVGAKPLGGSELGGAGKKGSDKGIDGVINYIDSAKQELKRVLVQVKSGHVNSGTIRDLIGTLNNEHAEIGVLITLDPPTRDMITAALTAGYYKSEFWQKSYSRLQILTIEHILAGAMVQMPPETGTFITAQRVRKAEGAQNQLDI